MADCALILIKFPHEKKCLYVDRNFLIAESSVFHRLIYEDPHNPKKEIEVSDVNSVIVHHAMQCINTSGKSLISVRLSLLLRRFAKDYEMKKLYTLCEGFLMEHLNIENVEVIHDLACHCSDQNIQFYCWLKFDSSWREIFSKVSFYQCSDSTMRRLVSRPIYKDLDEFFLWNALYTWGLTKMLRENSIENPVLHRKILEEFLPQIRFLIMKPEELNVIFNSKILTTEECNAIKIAYEKKDVRILPPTICQSMLTRTSNNLSHYVKHVYSHFCPKHTKLRYIKINDHFYAEFIPSHDCFLIGMILPILTEPNAPPLLGNIEIAMMNTLTNKWNRTVSWNLTISSRTIKLFPPIFIEENYRVSLHLSIQIGNLHWRIEPSTNCDIGQLGKSICDNADIWQSFYIKEPLLYF